MKAGWIFVRNSGGEPQLPAGVGGTLTNPLDITRITGGPPGNEHTHLLCGALAISSDQIGIMHEHFVVQGVQVTRPDSVPPHNHDLPVDMAPDWFLLFWYGSDADAAAIVADPQCFIACQAEVTVVDGETQIGDLIDTPWNAGERAWWNAAMLDVLGLQLPVQVDRGSYLVQLFVGLLLARGNQTEAALRFTS